MRKLSVIALLLALAFAGVCGWADEPAPPPGAPARASFLQPVTVDDPLPALDVVPVAAQEVEPELTATPPQAPARGTTWSLNPVETPKTPKAQTRKVGAPIRYGQLARRSSPGPNSVAKEEQEEEESIPQEEAELLKLQQPKGEPWYTAHAQGTVIGQGNFPFRSPYQGPNSLTPSPELRLTETMTLYLAARLWHGGSIIFNPEVAAGSGIGGTVGIAGFPNGEATRVGMPQPTPYFARFLYQQVFELGGEWEALEDAPNQLPGPQYKNNIIFKIGKMAATDDFDDNRYAHDPRTQFLNWALVWNGAWDYPANTRGYTYGGTVEMNFLDWSWRYGVFAEPEVANGSAFDPHILQANGHVFEFEQRYRAFGEHLGSVRLLSYLNNAHMGDYRVALREMPVNPDITNTRAYRIKYGFGLSWDQELTRDLGVFARLGWNDGHTETWAFTEIDETASLGMVLRGREWNRPFDSVGLAGVMNGLSSGHRDYLAAGGLGFILGDGRLSYAAEMIAETYYNLRVNRGVNVTFDLQGVANPAYNRDRGPVGIAAIRLHVER